MQNRRWLALAVLLVLGTLQMWDSGVHRGGPLVIVLGALGLAVPALALVSTDRPGLLGLGLAASGLLLLAARLVSPQPLPTLHLVTFAAALTMFLASRLAAGRRCQRAQG